MSVTIIIPCHNEADGLTQLHARLVEVLPRLEAAVGRRCGVLLFDNGSTDATLAGMRRVFGGNARFAIHHSPVNRGIGGALRDSLALTDADILVTMDADCTYDPQALAPLVTALLQGWDMATGSPYHPRGRVLNVPGWRLLLSKGLSLLYRRVAPLKLWTYTSMFRAYRRAALASITWRADGFLSTSEILMEAAAAGLTIYELPTTLATRRHGQSKIRIAQVMRDHLRYLLRLATDGALRRRLRRNFRAAPGGARPSPDPKGPDVSTTRKLALPSDGDHTGRDLGEAELALLREAIASGHLTSTRGTQVPLLEKEFAARLGAPFAYACASGSAAVHTAVAAVDPSPGDEIITTPVTDMGAITAIIYQGAIPVFCDVDPETYNVTAETIARKLSPHTKAIIVTHLFGNPCDMGPIMELARARGIPVIEDCAQAFLTTYAGQQVGTIGDIGCFSFQQGKHMTTGEGGIVVTADADYARRMFLFINKAWGYGDANADHYFLAPNYRLSELQGAVAVAQLRKLDGCVARRQAAAAKLDALLADLVGAQRPRITPRGTHTYWKYCLRVRPPELGADVNALGAYLKERGVFCAPRYIVKPAFECQVIRDRVTFGRSHWPWEGAHMAGRAPVVYDPRDYPGTYDALANVLVLPWNEFYTDEHVTALAEIIHEGCAHLRKGA